MKQDKAMHTQESDRFFGLRFCCNMEPGAGDGSGTPLFLCKDCFPPSAKELWKGDPLGACGEKQGPSWRGTFTPSLMGAPRLNLVQDGDRARGQGIVVDTATPAVGATVTDSASVEVDFSFTSSSASFTEKLGMTFTNLEVTEVSSPSKSKEVGVTVGDIVLAIDAQLVSGDSDAEEKLKISMKKNFFKLTVARSLVAGDVILAIDGDKTFGMVGGDRQMSTAACEAKIKAAATKGVAVEVVVARSKLVRVGPAP
jgi:hypothetical protein